MRIIVVTDPLDKTVAAASQSAFVTQMKQMGGQVEQYFVNSTDEKHHGVSDFANLAVAGCVLGRPSGEILCTIGPAKKRRTNMIVDVHTKNMAPFIGLFSTELMMF